MTGKRGPKTGSSNHSDYEKAAGIMLLAVNKNDYEKTAQMLGVTTQTVRDWEKLNLTKNLAIPQMLEIAIHKLLEMMPDKWTGNSWAVAFGILMDKWLLVNDKATSRTESLVGGLDNLPEEEKDIVIREARSIIEGALQRERDSGGSDIDPTPDE